MAGPISMYVPTAIIAAISLPLAFKLVPPNRFYGIRTARSMSDEDIWYRTNCFGGFMLLAAAAVASYIFYSHPELATGQSPTGVLVLVIPLFLALGIIGIYSRSISGGNG